VIDSIKVLIQPDGLPDGQDFRLQITDASKVPNIVTTPTPASLPLSYNGTEHTLPLCGSGGDFEKTNQKMTWKATNTFNLFDFVNFAGGVTLYQRVRVSGVLWVNGTSREVGGGISVVEVYHR
jgi:hypothetical protein